MTAETSSQAPETTGRRLATGLAKISIALRHHAWQRGHEQDLTPTQGQVLQFLSPEASPADRTLGAIATALGIRPSTASEAVQTLVEKGLLRKQRHPDDRRRLQLQLTRAGEEQARQVAQWPDFLIRVVDELPEDEQATFMRILQRMILALQQRGEISPARMCTTCSYFRPFTHRGDERPHHCAFVDAPLGDRDLRLSCPDHAEVRADEIPRLWARFSRDPELSAPRPDNP